MMLKPVVVLGVGLTLATASGCNHEFLGPGDAEVATLRVRVTGGIAGSDYTYEVSTNGHVTGVACVSGCDFAAGDTLQLLTPAQQEAFLETINASGLPTAGRPVDYGTECCDQLTFRVTYNAFREVRTFVGGIENLPTPLRVLVQTAQSLFYGRPPVIVKLFSGLDGFSVDPLDITDARVEGGSLVMDLRYSGGCQVHDIDAVAWTQWRGIDPAEIGIAVTHDSHGDTCEALVSRTLTWDLAPVRRSYSATYSSGPATVRLRVQALGTGTARELSFSF